MAHLYRYFLLKPEAVIAAKLVSRKNWFESEADILILNIKHIYKWFWHGDVM